MNVNLNSTIVEKKYRNTGFLEDTIDVERDLIFGSVFSSLPKTFLQQDGQWLDFLPEKERQSPKVEVYSCVSHTTCNAIEILAKRLYGEDTNNSDRYVAKQAGTLEGGTTPKAVFSAIRHKGLVPEPLWPTEGVMSFNEYYQDVPDDVLEEGLKWLNNYELQYEAVGTAPEVLKDALRASPLLVSVPAWTKVGDVYVRPEGMSDNHATTLVGYKDKEYWIVFDSYFDDGSPIKHLDWNINFGLCKRFHIEKLPTYTPPIDKTNSSFWGTIKDVIIALFSHEGHKS